MKVNGFFIAMAIASMIFVLLSVVEKGSVSTINLITIILDIIVIVLNIKRR